MNKNVGILGSGVVGQTLAAGFLKHGYGVMVGTQDASKHSLLKEKTGGKAAIGTFSDTAAYADILVLAVKGTGAETVLRSAGLENLKGKIIIDTTNPIDEVPPVNGVLKFFTTLEDSLMERLQRLVPG